MNKLLAASLPALLLALGCARGPQRASVYGEVRVGGEPLETGSIKFIPVGGNGPTAGAAITNGHYEIAAERGVLVGKNRVEVQGNRKSGRKIRNPFNLDEQVDELVEAVPKEFNEQSKLEREVAPGDNAFDFDLPTTAKPGRR
jgi:hypothetical protein